MSRMHIPLVSENHIGVMYRIFKYRDDDIGLFLNFVEPVRSHRNGDMWKVEFRVRSRAVLRSMNLENFVNQLQQVKGSFEWFDVMENFDCRIYLYVRPSNTCSRQQQQLHQSLSTTTQSPVNDKREKTKSRLTRDRKRSEKFRNQLSELRKHAVELGYTVDKEKNFTLTLSEEKKMIEKYIRVHEKKLSHPGLGFVKFVKPQEENPALEHAERVMNVKKDEEQPEIVSVRPIVKLTSMSVKSDDKRYIKGRILGKEIFPLVRDYLSVLSDQNFGVVTTSGSSRMGLELRLKSEGFPIGEELQSLYNEALLERGYTKEQINSDLAGLRAYEQTSRLIRLQTAREKTRQWYGLKGGCLPVVERSYHTIEVLGEGRRDKSVELVDALGVIEHFN